nr:MAG TPA: hypothetical protein [Caudoviricetes sp.]
MVIKKPSLRGLFYLHWLKVFIKLFISSYLLIIVD